ncbi:FtsQ-type POTRA domain-containing protein [Bacillus sp. FSL W7-1360]
MHDSEWIVAKKLFLIGQTLLCSFIKELKNDFVMKNDKVVTMPPIKEQRKRKSNRRLLMFVLLFFFFLLVLVYFQSPFSKVDKLIVTGNELIEENELMRESGIREGDSMWQLSLDEKEAQMTTLRGIKSVSIEKKWPTTVVMTIEEHERVGYVLVDDTYAPILASGEKLAPVSFAKVLGDAPILIGFSEQRWLKTLSKELAKTDPAVMKCISEIMPMHVEDDQVALAVYMTDGIEVRTSLEGFAEYMRPYLKVSSQIDASQPGVLHMKLSPYFQAANQGLNEDRGGVEAND